MISAGGITTVSIQQKKSEKTFRAIMKKGKTTMMTSKNKTYGGGRPQNDNKIVSELDRMLIQSQKDLFIEVNGDTEDALRTALKAVRKGSN
jgi:hypothetical protein